MKLSASLKHNIVVYNRAKLRKTSVLPAVFIRQSATVIHLSLTPDDLIQRPLIADDTVQPWAQIPTPKWTWIYALRHGILNRLHEYCDERFKQLGPIYREKLGTLNAVFLSDPKDVENVYKQDEKNPQHLIPDPMRLYTELTGRPRGLFFMDGEQWNTRRSFLNNAIISHPKRYCRFSHHLNGVAFDLIERWRKMIQINNVIPDLDEEIYNWSIESLGSVLFEKRLGCLHKDGQSEEVKQFVQSVRSVFRETMTMLLIPARLAKLFHLPTWTRFLSSMDKSVAIVNEMVLKKVDDLALRIDQGEDLSGMFLTELLSNVELTTDEIIRIITDLFSAASDTTAQAVLWALYLLAKHPESQQKILDEQQTVIKSGKDIQPEHIQDMPYLKGVLRETLRLYPIAPFLTRIMRRDIKIRNYDIPAGTVIMMSLYTMGRNPLIYSDPEAFKPERWMKSEERLGYISCHSSLPFGHSRRSCVGRRLAEYKMQLLIANLVKQFTIEPANENEVGIKLRLITAPSEPIKLRFKDRIAV